MTVTYSATKSFLRLLFTWKGSVWKAVFLQYIIFLMLYYSVNLIYRFAMPQYMQESFEDVVIFFKQGHGFIPIQFLLGFYVSKVISNWWDQLNCIAWPDKFLIFVTGNINGNDNESLLIRKTFARYSNLLSTLVWREISLKIKKRFPTDKHLIQAGLMSEKEYEKCREMGKISEFGHERLLDELWTFRSGSAMLTMYDWINIPLVYTQVVTLATYGYFMFSLIGRQSLIIRDSSAKSFNLYFPLFTTLEFLFYIGWLKVGEQLRCPFGEDDDDFDMNYILDRNIYVSNMLVNFLPGNGPDLEPETWWESPILPHTIASYRVKDQVPPWRLSKVRIKPRDQGRWRAAPAVQDSEGEVETNFWTTMVKQGNKTLPSLPSINKT